MKKILVLNFFPAFVPPSSGGELRYFNMYSRLSAYFDVTLLSPTFADRQFEMVLHSNTFREYRVPKEESIHHRLHHEIGAEGVCTEISALVCALSSAYPNEYHKHYFDLYEKADIIVHDFPYMVDYDVLWGFDDKPRVYNSHNVDYLLMKQLYRGENAATYLQYIFDLEEKAVTQSDLVFATSEEERKAFLELYGPGRGKIALAPNGIDPQDLARAAGKGERASALFIGSHHPPNTEAVDFILRNVAPKCPEIDFWIAGACGTPFANGSWGGNVHLLGRVDEEKKKDLFAHADVAVNPMFSGAGTNLKTLEYLSCGIPLISTEVGVRGLGLRDGEHFVQGHREDFAEKIMSLLRDERSRAELSRAGRLHVNTHYSWEGIAASVRDAMDALPLARKKARKRLLLLNDFSAARPTSGGEVRINRLYGELSRYCDVTLLCLNGSSKITRSRITQTFTEISFPKTREHIAEENRVNNSYWISATDIVSSHMCGRNHLFLGALGAFYKAADAVVLVHPYMLPAAGRFSGKPLIYESLNFETGLKRDLLKDHPLYERLIAQVEKVEKAACRESALLLGVSPEDLARLTAFSGISDERAHLVANGVDVKGEEFFSGTHEEVKKALHGRPSVIFVGSGHGPNITALDFIIRSLAPALPHCVFLVVGTVCNAFSRKDAPKNVLLFGRLDEAYKEVLLRIADMAINPMTEGSGSNLKLAEYLAHRLPTITTRMGARGYDVQDGREVTICALSEFPGKIEHLLKDPEAGRAMSERGLEYARRDLGWNILSDRYYSVLEETVFRTDGKKLLVLTYRFTSPPLGGAEAYLLNIVREMDRRDDFSITVATLDIYDIINRFHFSADYGRDCTLPQLPGMSNTVVYKFRCDRGSEAARLANARRLFARWMEEFVLSSLRHLDKYTFPLLMGGWHFPEYSGDRVEIWSGGDALIFVAGTEEIEFRGYSPDSNVLALTADARSFGTRSIRGDFHITLDTGGCTWLRLATETFAALDDARPLGIRVVGIRYRTADQWHDLRLNYNYRDFLKETCIGEYVDELIASAESRPSEYDDLFQHARGPVSAELCDWLDRNIKKYDVVLGHSVPFSTSVLAARYARKHDRPLVILPHFHADDEFYHWKSYYDALRSADMVLASPLSSIGLFFEKIGSRATYLPGGVDPKEFEEVDPADFSALYNSDLPFLLVLGRKAAAKNYHWAMHALKQVNAKGKLCNLVIIGRDEDGVEIAESDAIYLGERDRNVVLGALKECTALVNMSESESFGIVILEAWLQKKPVIVNEKCGAFVELVEDSVNGLLAHRDNLADRIRFLLNEPALAARMGEKGFEKVRSGYTWEAIGGAVNDIALGLSLAHPRERGTEAPAESLQAADAGPLTDIASEYLREPAAGAPAEPVEAAVSAAEPLDFEACLQRVYEAVLKGNDIAIDVGAHMGRHCIHMAKAVLPSGIVFAFEPLPMCRHHLAGEIEKLHGEIKDIVKISPLALSDYEGQGEFVVARDALAYSGLKERVYDTPTELERIQVAIRTIDSIFLHLPSLRYIKIDAEGGEYHILKGAAGCIRKFRPLISFEFGVNSIKEYGITPAEVAEFLHDNSYRIYDIRGNLLKTSAEFVKSATIQSIWDYIAVPAEDAALERSVLDALLNSAPDRREGPEVPQQFVLAEVEKVKTLWAGGRPHEDDFLFFRNLPAGDGIFLDIGANAGQSAVSFRFVNKDYPILSFEPNYMFRPVLQHVKDHLVSGFDFSISGFGDARRTARLIVPYVDGVPYFQECSVDMTQFEKPWVQERLRSYGTNLSFREMEIQVVAADELNLRPDVVKIDAEGFELAVLQGMKDTIAARHPIFLIENNDFHRVTAFLRQFGYEAFSYGADEDRLQPPSATTNTFYLHGTDHAGLIQKLYKG